MILAVRLVDRLMSINLVHDHEEHGDEKKEFIIMDL
jgi:hypothetical protein